MADGVTPGGALGRWVFHCHIFFHAELGMISELVVLPANGKERPDINVAKTDVQVNQGQTATVTGTYFDVDNEAVTLSSSVGTMHDDGGGNFSWRFPTGTASSQFVYLTATNADGTKAQIPFFLTIVNLGPPTLVLPASEKGTVGKSLKFGIKATDPDPLDPITLGASGLPKGLTFKDNHNRTGTVSGTVKAKPGKYTATFSASDGKHPATQKSLKITITAAELSAIVGKQVRVAGGAIRIGCKVLHGAVKTCTVTVFLGGKRVGSATARRRHRGGASITARIKLSSSALNKIKHAKHGVRITLHLVVSRFGTKGTLKADAATTAVRP